MKKKVIFLVFIVMMSVFTTMPINGRCKMMQMIDLKLEQNYLDKDEYLDWFIEYVCASYGNVTPELVHSVIFYESRYIEDAISSSGCVGLMQISPRWHRERADRLGVQNFIEPINNVLLGIDILSELTTSYPEDPYLVLMLYNMKRSTALKYYEEGRITKYAKNVMTRKETLHGRTKRSTTK
jgi:soluble lytic murein transglycosylase-like protein